MNQTLTVGFVCHCVQRSTILHVGVKDNVLHCRHVQNHECTLPLTHAISLYAQHRNVQPNKNVYNSEGAKVTRHPFTIVGAHQHDASHHAWLHGTYTHTWMSHETELIAALTPISMHNGH